MSNQKWDSEDKFYSGQGIVLLAKRDPVTGKPMGFKPIGNCTDLKVTVATSVVEKKESKSGQRALAGRLTTETKVNLAMTLDSFVAANIADSLRGASAKITGAAIVAEAIKAYAGAVSSLENIKVSAVIVKQNAVALTDYVNDVTPYDYKSNLDAGSIQFNDGVLVAQDKLGVAITAIGVGAVNTTFTIANTLVAGDSFTPRGVTGADMADLNGITFPVVSATPTQVVVALVSTAKVYTVGATAKAIFAGMPTTVDYTYATQYVVDALTVGATDIFMRFEGLNTADENKPVVVEVFKFSTDPLKELALISDAYGSFVLDGSVLSDSTRVTGSKFFKVTQLG